MRIAIIAHAKFPIAEPYAGGLEMITHLLVDALVNRGHQVDLYAHHKSRTKANLISIDQFKDDVIENLNCTDYPVFENLQLGHLINYSRVFNQIKSKEYDIVHNHSLNMQALLLGNMLPQQVITSLHTPPLTDLKVANLILKDLHNQYYTSVSNSLCKQWKEFIPSCTTIRNGIDVSRWEYVTQKSSSFVFWYGRICKEKAPHLAIEAALLKNKEIRLAGPIDQEAQEYYDTQIKKYINHPLVTFLGHLNQAELNKELLKSECCLFTSLWDEPYGLVLAETLATGTPLIAFDTGAVNEILNDTVAVIVEKGNVNQLAEALDIVKEINPKICRTYAEEHMSYERMVEDYIELYDHILEISQFLYDAQNSVLRT